ncbi:MAG: FeoB-associated Cys-rich membrane protein [Paenibacillus sp.]|nr:FeoB-associated Cys-rich membrane protein [Paenibacillus sp.]
MEKLKHRIFTIIFLFTTIFFFANGQEVKALSCAEKGSLQEELDGYTGAVYGEIKNIKVDLKQEGITGTKEKVRYILVEVERSWKTEVNSQVIVATDYTWGFNFKEGSKYFIFISEMDGELSSSPCSTTIEMNNLNQVTERFGEGFGPKQQVNLESKMWFMMEQDFDLYIVLAIILVVSAVIIMRARKKRKRG